jgi:hypothetical protein
VLNVSGKVDYTLICNRKNEPVLKILNIMILLSSEYNFKILNIVFDEILTKNFTTLNPYFDQN